MKYIAGEWNLDDSLKENHDEWCKANNMLLQPAQNIFSRSEIDYSNHTVVITYNDGTEQTIMLEGEK